jgi:hypothetical protein
MAIGWWAALSVSQTAAPRPIQLRVPARSCTAPCNMTVTVVIPTHPDNLTASVVWGYSDSTEWALGPETRTVEFPVAIGNLDAGDHAIYAVLVRQKDGARQEFEDTQHILVH